MHKHPPPPNPDELVRQFHPNILWTAVTVSTSFAVLYGLFIALAVVSLYLLLRRGIRRPLAAIQAFAVTTLLMSTTIHWAVVVLQRFGSVLVNPGMDMGTFWGQFVAEQCVGTATLTINIILSDLVVWWRAWVLWPESRMVRMSGCVLLLATFVVDTTFSCQLQMGFMFEGLAVGTAAAALSLATNFTATVLTAYQAWLYRKSARDYAESGSMNNRVQHILALLVESGALYCALWIVVIVWEVGVDNRNIREQIFFEHRHHQSSFWAEGGVLIEGCLVPLIAIYPTVIIVLVALNKSGVENGFAKRDSEAIGHPPGIAVAVETVVSTHSDDVGDSPSGTAGALSFSRPRFSDPSHGVARARWGLEFERFDLEEKMAQRT